MPHSNDMFIKSINPVCWAFWSHLSSKFNKVIIRTKNIPEKLMSRDQIKENFTLISKLQRKKIVKET
jgi:hypothetical protein